MSVVESLNFRLFISHLLAIDQGLTKMCQEEEKGQGAGCKGEDQEALALLPV